MLEDEKQPIENNKTIPTSGELLAAFYLGSDCSEGNLPRSEEERIMEDNDMLDPDEFDLGQDLSFLDDDFLPMEFPGKIEVETIVSFNFEELKRMKKSVLKDDPELEDLYLAIKLQEAIDSHPF
ncbi:hypothetical protein [Neobacillus jeddahensis]|uniref:hypothetical protein n=1 Tax=Neobacillus jeddahensis TaxID=1461580 RepID=UPI0005A9FB14|nr:hypothetical protein [Neobacillus jeddahensis]